jgi:hypothetical protein
MQVAKWHTVNDLGMQGQHRAHNSPFSAVCGSVMRGRMTHSTRPLLTRLGSRVLYRSLIEGETLQEPVNNTDYPILYLHTLCPYAQRAWMAFLEKVSVVWQLLGRVSSDVL